MNLGTLRTRVGAALGVAGGGSVAGTERTLIDGYVNEGVEQILLRVKPVKKTATVGLTANVGDYTLDPIMLSFEDVYIIPAANPGYVPMLIPVDSFDIRSMRNTAATVAAPAAYYAFEGNVIMLYPTPATGDVLHIIYTPRPTAMTDAAHDPSQSPYGEIPSEFHHIIEAYAKWKMADYADDASSQVGQTYRGEYEQGLQSMKATLLKKGGVRIGYARVGRRDRFSRYASPGVDVGD